MGYPFASNDLLSEGVRGESHVIRSTRFSADGNGTGPPVVASGNGCTHGVGVTGVLQLQLVSSASPEQVKTVCSKRPAPENNPYPATAGIGPHCLTASSTGCCISVANAKAEISPGSSRCPGMPESTSARNDIAEYIEWYNQERPHSAINDKARTGLQ